MTKVTSHRAAAALPHGVRGSADPNFSCAVNSFARMFPGRRFGGGALSVFLDGEPVVDIWTGWSDRRGHAPWTQDTGAMVFSATKGIAATVIHRLADRGLIDYDAPMAEYWPEFAVNGKGTITVRDVMRHRAGLSHLNGVNSSDLLNHVLMEERVAAAPVGRSFGKSAYHAVTFGWLVSGLARAVTGKGMRELIRDEVAGPLQTDGLHLGRPPVGSPTRAAHIVIPQGSWSKRALPFTMAKIAALPLPSVLGAVYFPGIVGAVQGEIPMLDSEIPSVNGVATARGLAKMYGAIANGGQIEGTRFLSPELVRGLTGRRSFSPDHNLIVPMAFHLGYHACPVPGVLPGFGHAGLGGSAGWADPASGMSFGFVHNRLVSPMLLDQAAFPGLGALIRRGARQARLRGYGTVTEFGSPVAVPDAVASSG